MFHRFSIGVLFLFCLVACSPPQQLFVNPNPVVENRNVLRQYFQPQEPVLKAGDKISVSIWGHDELSVGSINSPYNSNEVTGRWVVIDNDGEVNLPRIGRVKVSGYDLKEVNYLLESKYSGLLKEPIINVKVHNHYVTIMGEVNKPTKLALDNEGLRLIQAIGAAEGLSPYAMGDKVKVIRTVNNRPVELIVDLTDLASFSEYNVLLVPDDVVYVGPNKKKGADERLRRGSTIGAILTGIALTISVLFVR